MLESLGIVNIGMFTAGVVTVILLPGPNSLYVLSTALRRGVADGYKAAGAIFIGDSVIMLCAVLGVGSLLQVYPVAFVSLQYAGAAYLAWVGLNVLLGALKSNESNNEKGFHADCHENPFRRSLALSLSNPKAILFFVSFFVQFVDPSKGHAGLAFCLLACIVQAVSMTYLSVLIFGGATFAPALRGNLLAKRLGNSFAGILFLGFGVWLAFTAGR